MSEPVNLPRWAWSIMGAASGLCLISLASFFSWLGNTTVDHGRSLEAQAATLNYIEGTVSKIESKLDDLPSAEIGIRLKALESDAVNCETQLDKLERRVDLLERK